MGTRLSERVVPVDVVCVPAVRLRPVPREVLPVITVGGTESASVAGDNVAMTAESAGGAGKAASAVEFDRDSPERSSELTCFCSAVPPVLSLLWAGAGAAAVAIHRG